MKKNYIILQEVTFDVLEIRKANLILKSDVLSHNVMPFNIAKHF